MHDELIKKMGIADKKLKEIDVTLQKASSSIQDLNFISEFVTTLLDAQNGSRKALTKLCEMSSNSSKHLNTLARNACLNIHKSHSMPYVVYENIDMWKVEFDRSSMTINDFKKIYHENVSPNLRPSLLVYICKRIDISKRDKMQFLVDIMKDDNESLDSVEIAGRCFSEYAGLKVKPLQVELMLKCTSPGLTDTPKG